MTSCIRQRAASRTKSIFARNWNGRFWRAEILEPYEVTRNFFHKVTDLAAYRIMHLHPRQMAKIHPALIELFKERRIELYEPPAAQFGTSKTKKFYKDVVGLDTVDTEDKLYSSVHYVVVSNWTTLFTCEIQVRTLADEVWGEVDHTINYPKKSLSIACREQIKSLAHITTSCNRLVDSIFESNGEWQTINKSNLDQPHTRHPTLS